jgi:sugar phosphate permease
LTFTNGKIQKDHIAQYQPSTKHFQTKIFVLCWIAYASAYFCRVNMSVAIPAIQQSFGWSKTSLGLIGSGFFWVYGIGQLVNGYIGDKVSGRIFIFVGLAVSALINIFFGFTSNVIIMMLLWAVNGFSQSMLWGPIVRILSKWFPKEHSTRISVGISTSIVGGYLLAWGLSGQILTKASWPWVFRIPGIVVFIYAVIWLITMKKDWYNPNHGTNQGKISVKQSLIQKNEISMWNFIKKKKLWMIAIACMTQGIIKDSISLWGPAYLMETHNLDLASTTSYILLIPIMNFGGILLSGWLNKKFHYQHKLTILTMFGASIVTILGLFFFAQFSTVIGVVLLGCCSALMYGTNTLLLSVIPMGFTGYNKTSGVAGFLDFSSYMGAGLAGGATGAISEYWGWNGILIIWICMALLGMGMLFKSWMNDKTL